jgi:hypothetical protein
MRKIIASITVLNVRSPGRGSRHSSVSALVHKVVHLCQDQDAAILKNTNL